MIRDQKSHERWLENGRVILECQEDDFLPGAFRGIIGIPPDASPSLTDDRRHLQCIRGRRGEALESTETGHLT